MIRGERERFHCENSSSESGVGAPYLTDRIPRISNKFNRELLNILVISRMLQRAKDTSSEMLISISNFGRSISRAIK